ncbi:LOW QUALITY PROTEIN: mitochondrial assembly of ribosomal large subunit protein 1 [Suncus etruscus]|uniref:LOW QUALITY PROTEIN: mitochondrial assembly of ribosomal large subunit protein 1 n=1 Tax=Suncus etruscus TaxID=109475 RepID=UPI0021100BFA|nr:LOW QUALITY PROTEIN: mitochondrial assembly of ribosomal large subunit protein 1 [Suncus etruscus]
MTCHECPQDHENPETCIYIGSTGPRLHDWEPPCKEGFVGLSTEVASALETKRIVAAKKDAREQRDHFRFPVPATRPTSGLNPWRHFRRAPRARRPIGSLRSTPSPEAPPRSGRAATMWLAGGRAGRRLCSLWRLRAEPSAVGPGTPAGRLLPGSALGRARRTPDSARGLHGAAEPGVPAPRETRPEPRAAGTGRRGAGSGTRQQPRTAAPRPPSAQAEAPTWGCQLPAALMQMVYVHTTQAKSIVSDHAGPKFDIDVLVSLLRQENARDICVIRVPPEMKYTDYFVIGSGTSTRHLHAMAYYIVKTYKFLKCKSDPHVKIEGKDTDDWLCVDFGSMVIHLMLPETRELYELEKLWTLRAYDDQLAQITPETLPEDFILGIEDDALSLTPVEFKYE